MTGVVIIADDLTGACDTGVKLAHRGYDSQVLTSLDGISEIRHDDGVYYTLNTDSRSVSPDQAHAILKEAASGLGKKGFTGCYKKIDSVLRGNIGREIDVLIEVFGYEFAVIAPALPENGRTLSNGILHIDNPEGSAYDIFAADAVGATTQRSCGVIGIETVRAGAQAVIRKAQELVDNGITLVITDAETDRDLEVIAAAVSHFGPRALPAGSAGLVGHLFTGNDEKSAGLIAGNSRPVVTVIGSRHPSTVAQVQRLKIREDVAFVVFDTDDLVHKSPRQIADEMVKTILAQKSVEHIVVTTKKIFEGRAYSGSKVLCEDITNENIAETVTQIGADIIDKLEVGAIIASGGDIAGRLIAKLGAARLHLLDEPIAGVAAGRLLGRNQDDVLIATKSGGFGGEEVLSDLIDYMAAVRVADTKTKL